MISWPALLREARRVDVGELDGFLEKALMRIRTRKLPLRVNRRFTYPRQLEALEPLRRELDAALRRGPEEAATLAEVLRAPTRAYVIDTDESSYGLVGAYEYDGQVKVRIAVLRTDGSGNPLRVESTPEDADATIETLEQLYARIDERDLPHEPTRPAGGTVLWIGGSREEARDHRWRQRLRACLAAHGLDVTVQERPGLDAADVKRLVNDFSGAGVICWEPRLGHPTLAADIEQMVDPKAVVRLEEFAFTDALEELRLRLEYEPLVVDAVTAAKDAPEYEAGPTYYFKKVSSGGGVDKLAPLAGPCIHDNAWRRARGAPQAAKGIERMTGRQIKTLEHCDACSGGGMWKVVLT